MDASLPVFLTCFLLNFWHCSWLSSAELMALKSYWFRDEIRQTKLKNLMVSSGAVISTWTLRETHACWSHVDNNDQPRYLSFHICSYLLKKQIYFQCIFSCPLINTDLFVRVSPGIYQVLLGNGIYLFLGKCLRYQGTEHCWWPEPRSGWFVRCNQSETNHDSSHTCLWIVSN